jgi:D-alanyl-D-alanine carboxypeptidase
MSCRFSVKSALLSSLKKIVSGIVAVSFLAAFSTSASAVNKKYAAIVIDGNTGKVLHSNRADASRFPASLTKIMTLYILFDYLKKGRLTTNTKFYVTPHAAAQPPSKLGLKRGSYIKVKDIIGALVTKSANDAAATVAENIAGSEAKFARLMTRKAKSIGMNNTVFKNASGLPNKYQRTTARDMAKLSIRIMNDFPRYAKSFKTRRFKYRGRAFRNHNGLLYTYKGTEGIKTGYTRASGFNLTSSVKRGNKHLIAVVMGGRTARSRNAEMRRLLNKNFPRAVAMKRKKPLRFRMASVDPKGARQPIRYTSSTATKTSWKKRDGGKINVSQKPIMNSKSFGLGKYIGQGDTAPGYDIQIGAYQDRNIAVGKLTDLKSRAASVLEGHQPYIMPFEKKGVNYHRARFAGFSSRGGAKNACTHIKKKLKLNCIVMMP